MGCLISHCAVFHFLVKKGFFPTTLDSSNTVQQYLYGAYHVMYDKCNLLSNFVKKIENRFLILTSFTLMFSRHYPYTMLTVNTNLRILLLGYVIHPNNIVSFPPVIFIHSDLFIIQSALL